MYHKNKYIIYQQLLSNIYIYIIYTNLYHWKSHPSNQPANHRHRSQWPAPIDPTWRHRQRHRGPEGTQPLELDLCGKNVEKTWKQCRKTWGKRGENIGNTWKRWKNIWKIWTNMEKPWTTTHNLWLASVVPWGKPHRSHKSYALLYKPWCWFFMDLLVDFDFKLMEVFDVDSRSRFWYVDTNRNKPCTEHLG